jgi:hypothetical protein
MFKSNGSFLFYGQSLAILPAINTLVRKVSWYILQNYKSSRLARLLLLGACSTRFGCPPTLQGKLRGESRLERKAEHTDRQQCRDGKENKFISFNG